MNAPTFAPVPDAGFRRLHAADIDAGTLNTNADACMRIAMRERTQPARVHGRLPRTFEAAARTYVAEASGDGSGYLFIAVIAAYKPRVFVLDAPESGAAAASTVHPRAASIAVPSIRRRTDNCTRRATMTRVHHSLLALAGALALAPATVGAQETDTRERVSITGGYSLAEPTRNPQIDGTRTDVDGEGAPTLGVTYHVTDNIGIEAWGAADKFGHRVRTEAGKAASVSAQPVALSGQYRFGQAGQTVRPFVGLGVHETNFSEETATAAGPYAGQRIGVETVRGPMATAGIDIELSECWFARADVRYLHGDSDVRLDGAPAGEAKLEQVVVGVGVGVRF